MRRMFERAVDEFGRLDILVNNAGIQLVAAFEDLTFEQWQRVMDVNLTGPFLCCQEAVRLFKKQGIDPALSCAAGKILCISSVHEVISAASSRSPRAVTRTSLRLPVRLPPNSPGKPARPCGETAAAVHVPLSRSLRALKAFSSLSNWSRE